MSIFLELCFQSSNDAKPEHFTYSTEVKSEAGAQASWETWRNTVHFNTTISQIKTATMSVKVFDKNNFMGNIVIGETNLSLAEVLKKGWDSEVNLGCEFTKPGKGKTGRGVLGVYITAPFNWITCGLHAPKLPDCSCKEQKACFGIPMVAACHCEHQESCCNQPHCFNGCGCCHPNSCGTCHLPTGEKCCACHAPQCSMCSCATPSCVNLCGLFHSDCCAGQGKGTSPNCSSCGKCGVPTPSCACPCAGCGDCGGPCKCEAGHCHFLNCLSDLTCNGCQVEELWQGPVKFDKAYIHFNEARLFDKNGKPDSFAKRDLFFTLDFGGDSSKANSPASFKWDSHVHGIAFNNGLWGTLKDVAFLESSESLTHGNLVIKVMERKNHFGHNEIVAEGEISLCSLLQAGFHHQVHIGLPLLPPNAKRGATPEMKFEIGMTLQSAEMSPNPSKAQQRASISGRVKRSSILREREPDTIPRVLAAEHFAVIESQHLAKVDAENLIEQSLIDEDILVGFQIELLSRSNGKSKGTWVIIGIKQVRFLNTTYLLRNQEGAERWIVISKIVQGKEKVSGKPIILRRRVAQF